MYLRCRALLGIYDENDIRLWFPNRIILDQSFDFYVVNKTKLDKNGNYKLMDLVVQDFTSSTWSHDGVYNKFQDKILVGEVDSLNNWLGTAFVIDFFNIDSVFLPKAGSRYSVVWDRNFWVSDTFKFKVDSIKNIAVNDLEKDVKNIRVVPNPYVEQMQWKKLLLTHFLINLEK